MSMKLKLLEEELVTFKSMNKRFVFSLVGFKN